MKQVITEFVSVCAWSSRNVFQCYGKWVLISYFHIQNSAMPNLYPFRFLLGSKSKIVLLEQTVILCWTQTKKDWFLLVKLSDDKLDLSFAVPPNAVDCSDFFLDLRFLKEPCLNRPANERSVILGVSEITSLLLPVISS